jgi:type II secretory pathway pseudopilin PulG
MTNKNIAFTLIELLITIGLLALIVMIIIPTFTGTQSDAIEPIIQTELSEIQRAFFRLKNDCKLQQQDYNKIAQYGVALLLQNNFDGADLLASWDSDRQRGWRGPYLNPEGEQEININSIGQQKGITKIPAILAPTQINNESEYYRIIATKKINNIDTIIDVNAADIQQLWLVYPHKNINEITTIPEQNDTNRKYYRKLIADAE